MAAIDPSADPNTEDSEHKTPRATLKLLRIPSEDDDEDDEDWEDEDDVDTLRARLREAGVLGSDDDSDLSEDDESEEETNGGPSDPAKSKKAKREALEKKLKEDLAAEEMELDQMTNGANGKSKGKEKALNGDISSDSEDDEDDEGSEVEELVLCTLDPEKVSMSPCTFANPFAKPYEALAADPGDHCSRG
jgi:FK506-binding nuclear protein